MKDGHLTAPLATGITNWRDDMSTRYADGLYDTPGAADFAAVHDFLTATGTESVAGVFTNLDIEEAAGEMLEMWDLPSGELEDIDDAIDAIEGWVEEMAPVALLEAADMDEPGPVIRAVREGLGMSRAEFGERLGLDVQETSGNARCATLEGWETGGKIPGWESRKKIKALAEEMEAE